MSVYFFVLVCLAFTLNQGEGHPCNDTDESRVNCHGLHLDHIPTDLPRNTVWLDFSKNNLENLTDYMFQNLSMLQHLDLTSCSISMIEPKSFAGMNKLETLILANNSLKLNKQTYHQSIFLPLKNLTHIDICGNDDSDFGMVPDNVFADLSILQTLCIDTFMIGENFGIGFSAMTKLKSLILSNSMWGKVYKYCSIGVLDNKTFYSFENSSIETLYMASCLLSAVDIGAYLPLRYISEITLTKATYLSVKTALQSLFGINGKKVTFVKLNRLYSKCPQDLQSTTFKKLTQMCVEYLDLSESYLFFLHKTFSETFSRCLKHLDLSRNYLYAFYEVLFIFSASNNLEFLDISNQQIYKSNRLTLTGNSVINSFTSFSVVLPAKLQVFNMSSVHAGSGFLNFRHYLNASALKMVNFSYDGIHKMVHHIKGVENVETLDISGNNGGGITKDFITSFPNVRRLAINSINPGQLSFIEGSPIYNGLKFLKHLENIELESNGIQYLARDMFNDMVNLTFISLAHNDFLHWPIDIKNLHALQNLDLSENSFTYLPLETTQLLDKLVEAHRFKLQLKHNPISCSCQTLDFINWLFRSKVVLDEGGSFNCVTDDGKYTTTLRYYQRLTYHWRSCQGRVWLPFAVTFLSLLITMILTSQFIARNWTRIQHRLMVIIGRGVQRVTRQDFQKDVYIAHSEEDGRLVLNNLEEGLKPFNLRLILPDRDFLPGRFVADNVVESVDNSWKTVLVVTESFLDDPWSYFIMRTVSYSVSYPNSNRVILLMIGDVNRARLPESLLNVTEEKYILETYEFPHPDSKIWEALRDMILSESL